jgi:phenylalanyl-tRNA synthetase alpha chain
MSSTLHPIERQILSALAGRRRLEFDSLVRETGLKADQVRRAIEWLSTKKLVSVSEFVTRRLQVLNATPPELNLVSLAAKAPMTPDQLKRGFSTPEEYSAAFGRARAAGWVILDQTTSPPVVKVVDASGPRFLQTLLERLAGGTEEGSLSGKELTLVSDLLRRGILKRTESRTVSVEISEDGLEAQRKSVSAGLIDRLTPEVLAAGEWKGKSLRPIDVEARAPTFYPGRRHPVRDFIKEVRETYISMGFTEIEDGSVQPAFWNFDALFIPQDHPGREMQDTFYLRGFSDREITRSGVVARVASTHEDGWKTGSRGWGYAWRVEEAKRLVLRTHNTVLTIKSLSESGNRETRVFAVSKVYRNENLDYKHLAEFHHMDGIMVGPGLNMRHLMGFLTTFYRKLGLKEVKLWPTYFPYTEPSLQVMGYSEVAKDWVELGGSGVFRPEVTRPLGVNVPVLAWGPGIERLMLLRYELDDLRDIYSGDLSWLRSRLGNASR